MPDLDYVRVVGRFGLTVGDGPDADEEPDTIWCDEGEVRLTPLNTYTKVAGGNPKPWTAGHSVIDASIDADGYVTWNDQQHVWVVDLTSSKVNPRIGEGKATHKIEFRNIKADGDAVSFETQDVRLAADMADPVTGSCDLTLLMPVPAAGGVPIVIGPRGPEGPRGLPGIADDASMTAVAEDPASEFTAVVSAKIQQVGGETFGSLEKMPDNDRKAVGKGEHRVSVLDYGAWADGSHSTQNVAAFQAAVDAGVAFGVPVYIPAGYYVLNNKVNVTSNVTIFGDNWKTTTVALESGANKTLFEVATNVTGFVMEGVHLYGNRANNTQGNGIVFLNEGTSAYRGTGRLSKISVTNFAQNGVHVGRHRNSAYLDWVISGDNAGYGIYLGEDVQDTLIYNPNLGTNLTAAIYVNGSNNAMFGGQVYGSKNLAVIDDRASKFVSTGTVWEASYEDGIVLHTSATGEVSAAQFVGCNFGRIGLNDPAVFSLFKSSSIRRLVVSGFVYKKETDPAPAYLFDLDPTASVEMAGLAIQSGAYATGISKNGSSGFASSITDRERAALPMTPLVAGRYYTGAGLGVASNQLAESGMRGMRIVAGRTCTLDTLAVEVTVAGSAGALVRLGVYSLNPSTGVLTLLADGGTIGADTTGIKSAPISLPVTKGDQLVLMAAQQGAATTRATFRSHNGIDPYFGDGTAATLSGNVFVGFNVSPVAGALPTSPSWAGAPSGGVPRVLVKAS